MKLGAYTACLHDRPLEQALDLLAELGLTSAEVNTGGFLPAPHVPIESILASDSARDDYLGLYDKAGIALTGLNCNGNPLHPDPAVGTVQAEDLRRSIEVASRLGVKRIVTMSGLPAGEASGERVNWVVNPWNTTLLESIEYQWEVLVPFWKDIQARAADADVKIAIELHPHNTVFNPATFLRLAEAIDSTHVGVEMDPSHLFWQGMDPVAVVDHLGEWIFHAAAKDIKIYEDSVKINGVLDERFTRIPLEDDPLPVGGRYTVTRWPANPTWEFVALGQGHDNAYWTRFLQALHRVDPDMAVNIEHEDQHFDRVEGLRLAAENLKAAYTAAGI
ncbi:sugar phosphate isomerase/epimerase family protein [Glycomyces buryatensis]|uniref:Sugar phosphate isomerase/epimerase n=1 Tax=Glycomyces buryatensis TaxID=2570927 RepID=A0A4S8PUR9_9ACTN|nr:sugar phosphate isomerase/epimerase [Glycomyces buryatensis]THV35263.1 sugar phosphate isomerase/epimerase [Glycomyces buryatensis]